MTSAAWVLVACLTYVAGYLHGRYQARKVEDAAVSAWSSFRTSMRRHGFEPVAAVLSVGLILVGIMWGVTWSKLQGFVDCNTEYSAAAKPRSEAAEQRDEALYEFILTLRAEDRDRYEAAFDDLFDASAHLEKVREENKLPSCGE